MRVPAVVRWPFRIALAALALVGAGATTLAWMIATPTQIPPPLASISNDVRKIDDQGLPGLSYFQARDQTFLAYRDYQPLPGGNGRIAIVVHGSSAQSPVMHAVGKALAAAGVRAIAVDMRGHGHSGTRGDIAYMGQLDDDLADLVAHLRKTSGDGPISLVGHSIGGGYALRIAGSAYGNLFDQYVLLAPQLTPSAPSSRPGSGGWALPNIRRIVALSVLDRVGIHCCDALSVIAFALPDRALPFTTRIYSYRLLANFGVIFGYKEALARATHPITVIAGANDELMMAENYE